MVNNVSTFGFRQELDLVESMGLRRIVQIARRETSKRTISQNFEIIVHRLDSACDPIEALPIIYPPRPNGNVSERRWEFCIRGYGRSNRATSSCRRESGRTTPVGNLPHVYENQTLT